MSNPEENKKIVLEYFELFFNQHRIDEAFGCELIRSLPAPGLQSGPDARRY